MHEGHRARMFQRLMEYEAGLQEHELLEMLLYNIIPRKNTNEIAHRLLQTFGGIEGVFSASLSELVEIKGVGKSTAEYLRVVALLYKQAHESARVEYSPPNLASYRSLEKEICHYFQSSTKEIIILFALDERERTVGRQPYTSERKSCACISPEAISAFLAKYKPKYLVVMHNHVDAPSTPSAEDDKFTRQVCTLCSINNVTLYEHVILGTEGTYSYYKSGVLAKIRNEIKSTKFSDIFAER